MNKKVVFLPYDFDTALGTNNEGELEFSYNLEDIDHIGGGKDVYNGQQSVLWKNVRACFFNDIRTMYQDLRSSGKLSYNVVEKMFEDHQSKWPEALVNEDARFTYIEPYTNPEGDEKATTAYLGMNQGLKTEQRKWWMYNRFRYVDSKYNAGDALTDVITIRGYAKDNIKVTPYADIYATVKYGSYVVQKRATRNVEQTLECPLDNVNDTEIYIYSASQLASIGDISGLLVGYADFANAVRLQSLKIGDASVSYQNQNLLDLYLGNNVLLQVLDARNSVNLGGERMIGGQRVLSKTPSIDLSGCVGIEEAYFDNTSIKGVSFPVGGVLRVVHLPATITNLTLRNQTNITQLVVASYANVTTLRLENCSSAVDPVYILNQIQNNSRVRLTGLNLSVSSVSEIEAFYNKLDAMRGIDEYGTTIDLEAGGAKTTVIGTINIASIDGATAATLKARYPYVTIKAGSLSCTLTYRTFDGASVIDTETINTVDGNIGDGTKTNSTARAADAQYTYTPNGWARTPNGDPDPTALEDVDTDRTVYAAYIKTVRSYTVTWKNADGTVLKTETLNYGDTPVWTGAIPSYNGELANGWDKPLDPITGDTIFTAKYPAKYDVKFYNGSTLLETKTVYEGYDVEYTGATPVNADDASRTFLGWNTDANATAADPDAFRNITANRNLYAIYKPQFDVKFYNGSTLITTVKVEEGNDATYTGSTPVNSQDSSRQFLGWNTDSAATSTDPNALKNITADRNVYAIYKMKYTVTFYSGSTLLSTASVDEGGTAVYSGTTPVSARNAADIFLGWNTDFTAAAPDANALKNVVADRTVYAIFKNAYYVKFYNGSTLLDTVVVEEGQNATYTGSTPVNADDANRVFLGWSVNSSATTPDQAPLDNVVANRNVYAIYTPAYDVKFYNGSTLLQTVSVTEGGTAVYTGSTPVNSTNSSLAFLGWNTDSTATVADANALTNVTAARNVYAIFASAVEDVEITDSWDTILANIENGTYGTAYKIGNYKPLDLGTEGTINMQIVAMDADTDASGATIPLTFIGKELLATARKFSIVSDDTATSWAASSLRTQLRDVILPKIPSTVAGRIVKASKTYKDYTNGEQTSIDSVWIPSNHEIFSGTTYEINGPTYASVYTSADRRIKINSSSEAASAWWLRTALDGTRCSIINSTGASANGAVNTTKYIALGFCLGTEAQANSISYSDLVTAMDNGTYATQFKVGNMFPLDLGTEGQNYGQIVAFDADDKADGSGKAKVTVITKYLLKTARKMNATDDSTGGWAASEMRSYFSDTIAPLIPSDVSNRIVSVNKTYYVSTDGEQTSVDSVWIPSYREVSSSTILEVNGPAYDAVFADNSSRFKHSTISSMKQDWWLRSTSSSEAGRFYYVTGSAGTMSSTRANNTKGVALGFCLD